MPDKAWKKRERDVANYFNGKRTPLSGGNGKVTRADVIHDDLFIECKLRAKHTAISLWDDTAKLANSFSLRGIPTSVIINKNGEEFARIMGAIDFTDKKFVEWLRKYN